MFDPEPEIAWTVDADAARMRLDAFLAARLPWRSRCSLVARLRAGAVWVDGQPSKKARRLTLGARVELRLPARARTDLGEIALPVLFEDDALVVVDKPADLPMHAASTCVDRNVLACLRHRYATEVPDALACPSIVHRIDRGTTGVVAVARRREWVAFFMAQFERRSVHKQYVALVHGRPAARGRIELPLSALPQSHVVVDPAGKPACTEYEVIAVRGDVTMLRVVPLSGRKHQIRVHLAAMGHPIVFDDRYGRVHERASWPDHGPQLHAARLELSHPDGRRMAFEAPLPPAMRATFEQG